jgi:hypothetical protein
MMQKGGNMSDKASQKEIIEGKLKTALKLIKQKRYAAARQILREYPNHPKAQVMLQALEGKIEKRKGFAAISKSTLLTLAGVGVFLCIIASTCALFSVYLSQYSFEELAVMGMAAIGDDDAGLIAVAINYCKVSQAYRSNSCQSWPLQVINDYPDAAESCFTPYIRHFVLENAEIQDIRSCLYSYNVPRTS